MSIFKFIACSDLHIRKTAPKTRKDLYFSSIRRKICWLFKLALDNGACIISGGDIFDSVSVPHVTIKEIISLAIQYKVKLLTVYGQHDLRYHVYSSYKNTPLAILLSAIDGYHLDERPFITDDIAIQGASWECAFPTPIEGKLNIIATHRMVTEGMPLWYGHKGFDTTDNLINTSGFDIVVSGDNHKSFLYEKDGRLVVNSGSLVRSAISQLTYRPRVLLCTVIDGVLDSYEWIDVPVRDASLVFKEEEIEVHNNKLAETKQQLQSFTKQLNDYRIEKPDFMHNLILLKDTLTDMSIVAALDTIISKVQQSKV
jgi:predicted phosphodiesterase